MRLRSDTLRRQLILWLAVPLGVLWSISTYIDYDIANQFVTSAYDRSLLDSAIDIGKQITFSTMDAMGDRCAMIYGGPSLGTNGFLIQDCGGSYWAKRWNYSNGYIKRMSFVDDRTGWFVVGSGLLRVEKLLEDSRQRL